MHQGAACGRPIGGAWVTARGLPDNPRMRDGLEGAIEAEIGRVLARAKRAEIDDDDALEELVQRAGKPDVVVVDPPRAGLAGKALRRTGELAAERIVYVSCNPTTLASDVQVLRDDFGYQLARSTPVDMFPHTPHVESVSLLERAA